METSKDILDRTPLCSVDVAKCKYCIEKIRMVDATVEHCRVSMDILLDIIFLVRHVLEAFPREKTY